MAITGKWNPLRTVLAAGAVALGVWAVALPAGAAAQDRNHDGIPDKWETRHDLSLSVDQSRKDQDRDGIDNVTEWEASTDPHDADTDNDGVKDGAEDSDNDGVDNANEQLEGTSAGARDTNHNGVRDGAEDADNDGLTNHQEEVADTNPINDDTDGDGIEDGSENAGQIASFDGTMLTISVFGGSDLGAQVTDQTRIRCRPPKDGGSMSGKSHGGGGGGPTDCSTTDLVTGTIVRQSETESGVFKDVELVK